nr:MAG: DNA pilot protein [Microvirus sp.]
MGLSLGGILGALGGGALAPLVGTALAGASSLGTSALDYRAAKNLQDRSNNFSAYMANTAHQREVADLQAAGLNPILSAGGSGNPSPSSAQASMSWGDPIQAGVSTASTFNQMALTKANTGIAQEQKDNTVKSGYILDAQHEGIQYDNQIKKVTLENADAQQKANIQATKAGAALSSANATDANINVNARQQLGDSFATFERAAKGVSGAGSVIRLLKSILMKGSK